MISTSVPDINFLRWFDNLTYGASDCFAQSSQVEFGVKSDSHHFVLVDEMHGHVSELGSGHDDLGPGLGDSLDLVLQEGFLSSAEVQELIGRLDKNGSLCLCLADVNGTGEQGYFGIGEAGHITFYLAFEHHSLDYGRLEESWTQNLKVEDVIRKFNSNSKGNAQIKGV